LRRKPRTLIQAYADDGCRGKQAARIAPSRAAFMQAARQLFEA
jgi:hypothetical protein